MQRREIYEARLKRQQEAGQGLLRAAIGVVSIPMGKLGPDGKVPRMPVALTSLAARPALWVAWLSDAMLRSGKGFRIDSTKRRGAPGSAGFTPTKENPRRADKVGLFGSKLERRLLRGMQIA